MKHMATAISPHSLSREAMTEFARSSDATLLTFPAGDPDSVRIKDEDLRSLYPKRHLSIGIIDFYIKYLEKEALSNKDKDRFFFFNCSFFISTFGTKITSTDINYEQARQWIRGVNLFEKDCIFIPVHKSEHWSLIVIYHLNSLTGSPTDAHYRSPCIFHLYSVEGKHDDLDGDIRSFIFKSWTEIHQNSDILQALFRMKYVEAKVPQEDNGYDSGIYLLYYVKLFILESASPDFSFGTEQGKSHFLGCDPSKVVAKRKDIHNLILKLSGMTELQGTPRLDSSDSFSFLGLEAASEGRIDDVQNSDLAMVDGKVAESEHGGHQTGGVTVLNEHQPLNVNETLPLLGEETRLPQIEEIRRPRHAEESLLQAHNDTLILRKESENRRSRTSNWSAVETSVLLDSMVHFDRFLQGNNATRWDFIAREVKRVCGTTHSRLQCQHRFDTLSKAFKQVDEFCKTNGKEFSEITEKERREFKLATSLTREWYTLMAQHYAYRGKRPFDCASSSATEAPADCPLSSRTDTDNLLSSNAGKFSSEMFPEPPTASLGTRPDGTLVPESFFTPYPRPLVQQREKRSNERRSDGDEMKGVYKRVRRDSGGGLLQCKYEPRFKPPREKIPLPLGSYNTLKEAQDVRQIAAYYYGRSDASLDLGDGTHFVVPNCDPVELQSHEKRTWVQHKVKEVFAAFQMEKARLGLFREGEQLSPATLNVETQKEPIHVTFSSDFLDAGSMVVTQDGEPRVCLEGNPIERSSEGLMNDRSLKPKHKIFLSYSGAQKEFAEYLCKALEDRFYYPFFDRCPESLRKGERYLELIVEATQQCQMLIVVVSDEYFMSKWPMIELSAFAKVHKIHYESKSPTNGPIMLPLFYGLSSMDLTSEELQKKWFRKWTTLARVDPRNQIVVSDWKYALDILMKSLKNGFAYDRDLKEVVAYVNQIVSYVCKSIPQDIRWDDSHVQGKSGILKVIGKKIEGVEVSKRYKVKVLGLYGVGGIGKTTLCKVLCNELMSKYEGRVCHIEFPSVPSNDSKEFFQKALRDLTRKSVEAIQHLDEGQCKYILCTSLFKRRIFLALDNFSHNYQSIQLAKTLLQVPLHMDSLVLVTARSQSVLELLGIDGDACLEMPDLEEGDAVKLFLYHAIGGKEFFEDDEKHDIMTCVKRGYFSKGDGQAHYYHPLALITLGSQLGCYGGNPSIWVKSLARVMALS